MDRPTGTARASCPRRPLKGHTHFVATRRSCWQRLSRHIHQPIQFFILAASFAVLYADIQGVRIADTNNMGRVLIAKKSFSAGEFVLHEQPALVWRHGDYHSLVTNYLSAGSKEKAAVDDMFSLDVSPKRFFDRISQELSTQVPLSSDEILNLIKKARGNQIEYSNEGDARFDFELCTLAALFECGSKLSHSCSPNTRAEIFPESPQNPQRSAGFRAIRPITEGEQITFTYAYFGTNSALSAADILVTPTMQRRKMIQKSFHFFCHCDRCDGPDFCRPLKCGNDNCREFALLRGKTEEWVCPKCGTLPRSKMQAALDFEEQMDSKWKQINNACRLQNLKHRQPARQALRSELPHPADLEPLIEACAKHLGPTHFVVLKALTTLAKLCTDHATMLSDNAAPRSSENADPQASFTQVELRALSARAVHRKTTLLECVDAGCVRGAPSCQHAPLFFCNSEANWAVERLQELPLQHRDRDVLKFVQRYAEVRRLSLPMAPGSTLPDQEKKQRFLAAQSMIAESLAWATTAAAPSPYQLPGAIPQFQARDGSHVTSQ